MKTSQWVSAQSPVQYFSDLSDNLYTHLLLGADSQSWIGRFPVCLFKVFDSEIQIQTAQHVKFIKEPPFDLLDQILQLQKEATIGQAPFWFGYLGYEAFKYIEDTVLFEQADLYGLPDIFLALYQEATCWTYQPADNCWHVLQYSFVFSSKIIRERKQPVPTSWQNDQPANPKKKGVSFLTSQAHYLQKVAQIKAHIVKGDIYQANYTHVLRSQIGQDTFRLFTALFDRNPAEYFSFLRIPEGSILCTSPEKFLQVDRKHIVAAPIKGTIARNPDPEIDELNRLALASSEKDLAELSMIVDLFRNDLNRCCIPGSVRVEQHATIMAFSNVYHLVSQIEGILADKTSMVAVIKATFPSGSITGCPKIKSVQILSQLEVFKRGVFTGCIGFLTYESLNFNVAIRTIICQGDQAFFPVGGGIVYDSQAISEYQETIAKAKTFIDLMTPQDPGE